MNLKPFHIILVLLANAILACLARRSEWYIFVADPFVFAQAFVLSLRAGTARIGLQALAAFFATLLYLLALALLIPVPYFTPPFRYPDDVTLVLEYSPGANSFAHAPALMLLVMLPVYAYKSSTRNHRSSIRSLLVVHGLAASISVLIFRVPFNGITLGQFCVWTCQLLTAEPSTLFIYLLWGLYLIDGWSGVAALKWVKSRKRGRFAASLIIPLVVALLHLLMTTSWHHISIWLIAETYYPRLALGHCLGFAAVAILFRATEDAAERTIPAGAA